MWRIAIDDAEVTHLQEIWVEDHRVDGDGEVSGGFALTPTQSLSVGPLHLVAHVDSIHADEAGRTRFHYTILDFAAAWVSGEPAAGSDVSAAAFFRYEALPGLGLWSEAFRVIAAARKQLGL